MSGPGLEGIRACVFDAYGTLFDFASAVNRCRERIGSQADQLNLIWRDKQLQYTWLRAVMGRHVPFHQVTADALDYALAATGLENKGLRDELLLLYYEIEAFEEVKGVLAELKRRGQRVAILSNGSPEMLDAAVTATGIGEHVEHALSVEEVGVYKPDFRVYQLACDRLGLEPREISFQSSNSWDAVAARTFGMNVVWINRYDQPRERLTADPDIEIKTLAPLPDIVAGSGAKE